MSFVRVAEEEIQLGQPLAWPLFDARNKLLLARGAVLQSEGQRQHLLGRGLFRKVEETPEPAPAGRATEISCPLEDVRLYVGETMQLQAQGEEARHYVKLIGYLQGRSVLVSTPVVDGRVLLLREGQSFVVRLFSGKSVYAFQSTVQKVVNTPYPYLHMSYPVLVRGISIRRGARCPVNLITAVTGANQKTHAGTITDLSTGGAMFVGKGLAGVKNDKISLKFRLQVNGGEQYLSLNALLRSIHYMPGPEGSPPVVGHGLQFEQLTPEDALVLSAVVYQRLFEDAAASTGE